MNIYKVYYRANSSVEIELVIVAPSKDAVLEYCFEDCDQEIPREEFYISIVWSPKGDDADKVKTIYRHVEEQR